MVLVESKLAGLNARSLERFAALLREEIGLGAEIDILIASNSRLKVLNRNFRGKNRATDVLSFPVGKNGARGGDIAISAPLAREQAKHLGHSLEEELKILMLHGMLHLAGLDHEQDDGQMGRREEQLRRRLKLPTTLIERSQTKRLRRQR